MSDRCPHYGIATTLLIIDADHCIDCLTARALAAEWLVTGAYAAQVTQTKARIEAEERAGRLEAALRLGQRAAQTLLRKYRAGGYEEETNEVEELRGDLSVIDAALTPRNAAELGGNTTFGTPPLLTASPGEHVSRTFAASDLGDTVTVNVGAAPAKEPK